MLLRLQIRDIEKHETNFFFSTFTIITGPFLPEKNCGIRKFMEDSHPLYGNGRCRCTTGQYISKLHGGWGTSIHAWLCEHGVAYIGEHSSVNTCRFMQVEEMAFYVQTWWFHTVYSHGWPCVVSIHERSYMTMWSKAIYCRQQQQYRWQSRFGGQNQGSYSLPAMHLYLPSSSFWQHCFCNSTSDMSFDFK